MTAQRKLHPPKREIDLSELFHEVAEAALDLSEVFTMYAAGWVVFHGGRQAELIRAHLDPVDGLCFEIAYIVEGMLTPTVRVSFYDIEFLASHSVVVDWEE